MSCRTRSRKPPRALRFEPPVDPSKPSLTDLYNKAIKKCLENEYFMDAILFMSPSEITQEWIKSRLNEYCKDHEYMSNTGFIIMFTTHARNLTKTGDSSYSS